MVVVEGGKGLGERRPPGEERLHWRCRPLPGEAQGPKPWARAAGRRRRRRPRRLRLGEGGLREATLKLGEDSADFVRVPMAALSVAFVGSDGLHRWPNELEDCTRGTGCGLTEGIPPKSLWPLWAGF